MKKYSLVLILLLFATLTVIYFRSSIFCGPDVLITRHLGSDVYSYLYHAVNQLQWLKQGFIPVANYWVPHGGGFPASPMDQLIVPSNLVLVGLYALTGNVLTTLRIFDPLTYFLTLLATYWFGTVLFGKRIPSIVLAVAYTFSMYGVGQLEHLDLLSAMILVPLTLGFLELMLRSNRDKYIVLTAFFSFLVYLTHPYAAFFLLVFMTLRFVWKLATEKGRVESIVRALKLAGLTLLMSLPFLILQLTQLSITKIAGGVTAYSQPPGLFFFRLIPSFVTPEITMYLGITIVVLALLPIVLNKTNKTYVFYLAVAIIAIIYTAGKYGPINLAQLVYNCDIWFIRVPGRAMIIGTLALAVCVGISIGMFKGKHQYIIAGIAVVLIFCDLTIGYEPSVKQMPLSNNAAYQWLAQQQGDFRIVEVPSVYAQAALTNMYADHDTLGWTMWDYGYYKPLNAPGTIYQRYVNETEGAVDATTYNVKYVIVDVDPNYFVTMKDDIASGAPISDLKDFGQVVALKSWLEGSQDYKLVYSENTWYVYENLQWRGFIYGSGVVNYNIVNNNRITISIDTSIPTTIQIAQSFDKGWKANIGTLTEKDSEQLLSLPAGKYVVTLEYAQYSKSLLLFLIWIPLIGVIVWMLRREIQQ